MTEESEIEVLEEAEAAFLEAMKCDKVIETYGQMRRNKWNGVRGWRNSKYLIPEMIARSRKIPVIRVGIAGLTDNLNMTVIAQSRGGSQREFGVEVEFDEMGNPAEVVGIKEVSDQEIGGLELSGGNKIKVMKMTTVGLLRGF